MWRNHQLQYTIPATRSATTAPAPVTLIRTTANATANATATLSQRRQGSLDCCHIFVGISHCVPTTALHSPRINIIRPLPIWRSTENGNEGRRYVTRHEAANVSSLPSYMFVLHSVRIFTNLPYPTMTGVFKFTPFAERWSRQ